MKMFKHSEGWINLDEITSVSRTDGCNGLSLGVNLRGEHCTRWFQGGEAHRLARSLDTLSLMTEEMIEDMSEEQDG